MSADLVGGSGGRRGAALLRARDHIARERATPARSGGRRVAADCRDATGSRALREPQGARAEQLPASSSEELLYGSATRNSTCTLYS